MLRAGIPVCSSRSISLMPGRLTSLTQGMPSAWVCIAICPGSTHNPLPLSGSNLTTYWWLLSTLDIQVVPQDSPGPPWPH